MYNATLKIVFNQVNNFYQVDSKDVKDNNFIL